MENTMKQNQKIATVWSYDVWGNAKDGFEVNDRSCFLRDADFSINIDDDREILVWLKKIWFIRKGIHLSSLVFDGDDTTIYIEQAKNGYPLGCIELSDKE